MSQIEKLLARLCSYPKNLTYDEVVKIFAHFGYTKIRSAEGSRVIFTKDDKRFRMHKPHPSNIIKSYMVKEIVAFLKQKEDL
ncbi:MAG: type II toxin-antitoxin system HicA family toxin [Erysipelotrichaceae bacterium]|nr:type II toxin-antitoxin system HicA family toxin [Erysipelotrichaceae bacterium]